MRKILRHFDPFDLEAHFTFFGDHHELRLIIWSVATFPKSPPQFIFPEN